LLVVGAQAHDGKEEERSSGPGFGDLIWEEDRSRPVEGGGGAAVAHAGGGGGTNVGGGGRTNVGVGVGERTV
jgi:hypothetical protein